jgi:hypothetical protein
MQELSAIESEQQRDNTGSPPVAARQPSGTKKNLKLWIRPNALGRGTSRSTWDESDCDSSEDQTSRGRAKMKKAEANERIRCREVDWLAPGTRNEKRTKTESRRQKEIPCRVQATRSRAARPKCDTGTHRLPGGKWVQINTSTGTDDRSKSWWQM